MDFGRSHGEDSTRWLNSLLSAHEKAAYQKAADEYSRNNPELKVTVEAGPDQRRTLLSS